MAVYDPLFIMGLEKYLTDEVNGDKVIDYNELYEGIIEGLKNHEIPDRYPKGKNYGLTFMNHSLNASSLTYRDEIIDLSGFVFLSKEWVEPLSKWIGNRKCLEVMAGTGSLSKSLQDYGVNIIATDIIDDSYFQCREWEDKRWTDIEQISAVDAIEKYGKDVDIVIMSWPPYQRPDGYEALMKMREINPDLIMIYIGETEGGCTADDDFFEVAEYIDDESFDEAVKEFKSSFGIHDFPMLVK